MKICLSLRLQLGALLVAPVATTSCVQTWPANREFETRSAFLEEGDLVNEAISSEDSLKQIPAEPHFKQLHYRRTIDPAFLRVPSGPYRVGPGDKLDIEVAENADTRQVTKVMPDGMLYYDVAGGINVKGMSTREISAALTTRLEGDYVGPVVSVNVADADSQRFWLLGQVKTPGAYPIKKPTTVIDAISQGGGLLSFDEINEVRNPEAADLKGSILIRDGDLIPVNFDALVREGDMSQNVYIRPGDYLFIPSITARSIYVLGEVISPGPIFYEKGTTLGTAVAAAGGVSTEAVKSKALILRGGTRDPKVAVVDIEAVTRGKEPDLALEGGDIVWVPRNMWTNLKKYAEAILITASQAVAIQESITVIGGEGRAGVTIPARGGD